MTATEHAAVSPDALFVPLALPRLTLKNRLIRSALNLDTNISPHPTKPPGER